MAVSRTICAPASPGAEMFFCDLDAGGAQFCAKEFRGTAIASRVELTEVNLPRDCDVIWVGSLFTHLDRARTERWLRHLCGSLSERGVLVATFHGRWTIELQEQSSVFDAASWCEVLTSYQATGFGYARYPDKPHEDYGISLSRPSAIVAMVEDIPNVRLLSYAERGWAGNHDVLGIGGLDRLKPW